MHSCSRTENSPGLPRSFPCCFLTRLFSNAWHTSFRTARPASCLPKGILARSANANEVLLGSDEQTTQGDRRARMTQLFKRITMQHFEFIAGFNYDDFPGCGNTEEAIIHHDGRTEIIATDAFLVFDFAGGCFEAAQDSV